VKWIVQGEKTKIMTKGTAMEKDMEKDMDMVMTMVMDMEIMEDMEGKEVIERDK